MGSKLNTVLTPCIRSKVFFSLMRDGSRVDLTRFTTVLWPFSMLGTNIRTRVPDYVYIAQIFKMSANDPFYPDVFRDCVR